MRKNYVLFCTFFKAFFGYFVTIGEYLKFNTLTSSPLRHYHQTHKPSTFPYTQKHPNSPSTIASLTVFILFSNREPHSRAKYTVSIAAL
jgi:hypothetical protein